MSSTQTTVGYTKGPWQLTTVPFEIRNTDSAAAIYGPMSKDGGACLIADISRSAGDEEAEANAKLIAAAPELLEALKEEKKFLECLINIVAVEHTVNSIRERLQTIEAAIQKATH
jgi:hypothetical protein